jgi:hypothetical protein
MALSSQAPGMADSWPGPASIPLLSGPRAAGKYQFESSRSPQSNMGKQIGAGPKFGAPRKII